VNPTRPIYLDFQATTPVDPRVLATMLPYYTDHWGNSHATDHIFGRRAAEAVAAARHSIAGLIGADAREIIFTSGATEANNFLLKGAAQLMAAQGRPAIVTLATEHKAVLEVIRRLEREGHRVDMLGVPGSGIITPDLLTAALAPDVGLVSIMAVNNEIGVEQPLQAIGAACRSHGALFHSDAAQAVGKLPLDVGTMQIDLMSLSAHKLYGPQGIGAAYIRRDLRRGFAPLIEGGGQESGLRGGTLPTPLCVGFGAAAQLAGDEMAAERAQLTQLRDRFLTGLALANIAFVVNGDLDLRWPGNLNISFRGVDSEALLMSVGTSLALSSGSACTAQSLEPSHVILALTDDVDRAESAIRIGFGRSTTAQEIDRALAIVTKAVKRLRSVSPAATGDR
jgi:cysteine desulfurase